MLYPPPHTCIFISALFSPLVLLHLQLSLVWKRELMTRKLTGNSCIVCISQIIFPSILEIWKRTNYILFRGLVQANKQSWLRTCPTLMAFHRTLKSKSGPSSSIIFPAFCIAAIALLFFFASLISTNSVSSPKSLESVTKSENNGQNDQNGHEKFLYWGNRIDCPGKHCESCEGLGHQESSLRCALEEAMFLRRYFMSCFGLLDFFLFCPFVFISVFGVYALCGCWEKCGKTESCGNLALLW